GDRTVSCLRGFEGLLAQHPRDGVDRGVHGFDPPEVGLDDFLTGRLPGSDGFGQVGGAYMPEVSGRDAHVYTSLCGRLRRHRTAVTAVATASAPSAAVAHNLGFLAGGCLRRGNGANSRTAAVPAPGSRRNRTRAVPAPNREKS